MAQPIASRRWTGGYYAALTFGSLVVAAFTSYFQPQHFYMAPGWTLVAFALAAVYAAAGMLAGGLDPVRSTHRLWYFLCQAAIVTTIIVVSPARGFVGIIVLPLVSQGIFDLRPRYAIALGAYLYLVVAGIWAIPYGWSGFVQGCINYSTAFLFTAVFTVITKQAVLGRQRESRLREEVERANQQLREQARQMEELATTRERNRVAREIHDGVGHYLTVIKTQLDAAAAVWRSQPDKAEELLLRSAQLSAEALDDVRRSVGALRTDGKRPPLAEALAALTRDAGIAVTLSVTGEARPLSPAIEHALFRTAQEGLTNVRKHAQASRARVTLRFDSPSQVALVVSDDGRGRVNGSSHGFGLQGIRERIELLGGKVDARNRAEGGFELNIEVPA